MNTTETTPSQGGLLGRFAPLGGLIFAIWLLVGFLMSSDYEDTAQSVIAYADGEQTQLIAMQVLALVTPLLLGWFLYGLLVRLPVVEGTLRALTVIGGTLFITFFTIAFTLWFAPLLDESLTEVGAEAYLAFDDVGWVLLGASGIAAGVMILAVSAIALRHRLVPAWAGWLSVALGVLSLATVMFVGMFAWIAWFIVTGVVLVVRRPSVAAPVPESA